VNIHSPKGAPKRLSREVEGPHRSLKRLNGNSSSTLPKKKGGERAEHESRTLDCRSYEKAKDEKSRRRSWVNWSFSRSSLRRMGEEKGPAESEEDMVT